MKRGILIVGFRHVISLYCQMLVGDKLGHTDKTLTSKTILYVRTLLNFWSLY